MSMKRLIDGNALASLFRTRRAMDGNPTAQDVFETAMWNAAQAEEITLNALRDEIYQDALEHGLWEEDDLSDDLLDDCYDLIRDEVDELDGAIEEWARTGYHNHFAEELADVIIMSLSVAGKLGIDIGAAVKRKMEINKRRPWKHEGEK